MQLPAGLEQRIRQFAATRKLGPDEACAALLEAGLRTTEVAAGSPTRLVGAFASPEDCELLDEAVALARGARQVEQLRFYNARFAGPHGNSQAKSEVHASGFAGF